MNDVEEGSSSALLTDLYQLTMAHAYFELGMSAPASFELFVRRLPPSRRFLVWAGVEEILRFLETLRFTAPELDFLAGTKLFPAAFLDHLAGFRFTGSVHAMPEGTPCFGGEPLLRVTAPLTEAQLVESRLMNLAHFQTLVASKAARCVLAAGGRELIDFGMRRAHGAEAAVLASRSAWLAGFHATATVEAGRRYGIPVAGTMAHSFIQAHDEEETAFRDFVRVRGAGTSLLIDTYDTRRAAVRAARLHAELESRAPGGGLRSVRIDSGDLAAEAAAVRRLLDEHGASTVRIVLSGNLDEYRIETLLAAGAPVDAFGVGTHLDVSADAPSLDMGYKLQSYAGRPRRKRSPGKKTWPGIKQVLRERDAQGCLLRDTIALDGEAGEGEPLLVEVMREGRRLEGAPPLQVLRERCVAELARLPASLRELGAGDAAYPVRLSPGLEALAASLDATGE